MAQFWIDHEDTGQKAPQFDYFFRQRRKALAFCSSVTGFVNPPIGKALAGDALQSLLGVGLIVNFERRTVAVAEVKFRQVAMQMRLATMLIDALHAAFEDAEKTFNGVG